MPCIGHEFSSQAMTCHEMGCRGAYLSVADCPRGRPYMLYTMAVVATTQRMCRSLCSPLFCIGSRCKGSQTTWMHGGCWAQCMLRMMMTPRLLLPWHMPSRQTQPMLRWVVVFRLMNHAFVKALLFLSAGSVIHALSDQNGSSHAQPIDIR